MKNVERVGPRQINAHVIKNEIMTMSNLYHKLLAIKKHWSINIDLLQSLTKLGNGSLC